MKPFTVAILIYEKTDGLHQLLGVLSDCEEYIEKIIISIDSPGNPTVDGMRRYVQKHVGERIDNVVVTSNDENLGIKKHFLKLAQGVETDYALMIGCDDCVTGDYFTYVFDAFQDPAVVAVTPNQIRVNEKFQEVSRSSWRQEVLPKLEEIIQNESFGVPSAGTSFRSKLFEHLSYTDDMLNEDDQLMMLALLMGKRSILKPKLFRYRVHSGSLSSWLRKPFLATTDFETVLKTEFSNRRAQNEGWRRIIDSHAPAHQKELLKRLCASNIEKYERLYSYLQKPYLRHLVIANYRRRLLYNFVRFNVGRIFFRVVKILNKGRKQYGTKVM